MGAFECFFLLWLFFEAYKRIITVSKVCSTDIRRTKVIQNGVGKHEITTADDCLDQGYVHTIPDSFYASTKTLPDMAAVHT